MSSAAVSKAAFKARAQGLRINTNISHGDFQPSSSENKVVYKGEIFTQLSTAPAVKQTFGAGAENSKPTVQKPSEAMLSTDWRKGCRLQKPPPTAPPQKVVFSEEEIKPKKLPIDTSIANNSGPRRYRDTPVDPEFIHSAPATKQEFGLLNEDDDEDEDDDDLFYPTPQAHPTNSQQASTKQVIRLNSFIPPFQGFGIETAKSQESSSSTLGSPYMMINPVSGTNVFDVDFPLAQIQSVKNGKRFNTKDWDDVDPSVKQKLAELEPPHTAGLPVDALRREIEQREAEVKAEREKSDEAARFQSLLKKLQGSRDSAAASHPPRRLSLVEIKPPFWTKESEKEKTPDQEEGAAGQRRSSHDSAISDVSLTTEKKSSSLNPKASEFFAPSEKASPPLAHTISVSVEQFQEMCERLRKLEEEIAKEKSLQSLPTFQQHASPFGPSVGAENRYVIQPVSRDPSPLYIVPLQNHPAQPMLLAQPSNHYPIQKSNPGWNHVDHYRSQVNGVQTMPQPVLPVAFHHAQHNGAGPNIANNMRALATAQQALMHVQSQPPPDRPAQMWHHTAGPGVFGRGAPPRGPRNSMPPRGPRNGAPFPIYPIGPKPVRKPKGPAREGDFRQTMHQQEYEEYLEWKRSTDTDYARSCRTRQARRAERLRSEGA